MTEGTPPRRRRVRTHTEKPADPLVEVAKLRKKVDDLIALQQGNAMITPPSDYDPKEMYMIDVLCDLVGTVADIRDAALVGQTTLHSGNQREALMSFFDVCLTVCDIAEVKDKLYALFPNHRYYIEQQLRNADGSSR